MGAGPHYNAGVARLLGFFAIVLVTMWILSGIPVLGAVFRIPFVGFWLSAILVSAGMSKLAADLIDRRRVRALERELGAVETPHNRGKLGTLLLTQRRYRRAIAPLEQALEGEPESAEWAYRLGCALGGAGRHAEAARALERGAELNEEHAYGRILLRLAEAQQATGDHDAALAAVERFERNHGESPESAYRRGVALKGLGRAADARTALAEVSSLAQRAAKYQKKGASAWVLRAFVARVV